MSEKSVIKIMILFYSRFGNTAKMAEEIAYGAKEISGISVAMRRIADDVSMEVVSQNPAWSKVVEDLNDRYPTTPIENLVNELPQYAAIIFGSPTRFGNMASTHEGIVGRN